MRNLLTQKKIMLPKINRLKKAKDIEKVVRTGQGIKEGFLILKFIKNNLNQNRFGVSVSQKISKKATLRNKIKRRLINLLNSKLKKIKEGIDIFLIVLPGLENKDFWETEETINKIFNKAKILKND